MRVYFFPQGKKRLLSFIAQLRLCLCRGNYVRHYPASQLNEERE